MPRRGRGGGVAVRRGQRGPPPNHLQLPNHPPHSPYNPPMPPFNPLHWRRTTLQGGLSERAAEDTATQLLDALADKGSRQELRDIVDTAFAKHDLRIIAALGAATTIIIAAMALLKLFG